MPISKDLFDSIDKDGGFASATQAKASSKASGSGGDMVDSFIAEAAPIAEQISKKIGVSPHIVMAQMALETGWGKSIIPGTNNWGNIKDFSGNGVAATDNQTGSRDKYRVFGSGTEYADAASDLLARKYKSALGTGDNALAYATQRIATTLPRMSALPTRSRNGLGRRLSGLMTRQSGTMMAVLGRNPKPKISAPGRPLATS